MAQIAMKITISPYNIVLHVLIQLHENGKILGMMTSFFLIIIFSNCVM
jgi:hypothetical protein